MVILLWYFLAIGKGSFSHESGLSNADSSFLSCFIFLVKMCFGKKKTEVVAGASVWSPVEGTTIQLVTHGWEGG